MNLSYNAKVVWKLINNNRFISILLIIAYSAGFLFPALLISYKNGLLDAYNEERQFYKSKNDSHGSLIFELEYGEIDKIKDIDYLKSIFGEDIMLQIAGIENTPYVSLQNIELDITQIYWILPSNDTDFIMSEPYDLIGKWISAENPYDIVLCEKAIKGKWKAEDIIGKRLEINGEEYTISGILKGPKHFKYIYANNQNLKNIKTLMVSFKIKDEANIDERLKELEKDFVNNFNGNIVLNNMSGNSERTENFKMKEEQKANKYIGLSILAMIFCVLNSYSLMRAIETDNKKSTLIRMSLGAKKKDILIEQLLFNGILSLISMLIAIISANLIQKYFLKFTDFILTIDLNVIFALVLFSIAISLFSAILSTKNLSKSNLSSIERGQ